MLSICWSRSSTLGVGRFIGKTHRVWRWFWDKVHSTIHYANLDGVREDVFVSGRKPNRFLYSHSQPRRDHDGICLVQPSMEGEHWRLLSSAMSISQDPAQSLFLEVLQPWGNTWLWEHMAVHGGVAWLEQAISVGTLVAVTDGSYILELYPNLCLAAFVLEYGKGQGRVIGSFSEALLVANPYRGELLGLLAIHLILLSIHKIHQQLSGSMEIVSDCLGALKRLAHLPPYWLPSWCRHSDILKTILLHCCSLLFTTYYLHIRAHQDNKETFCKLSRKAQLNCICNHAAKLWIAADGLKAMTPCRMFLLEPIGLFVGSQKMTLEKGDHIQFWVHHHLVQQY